MEGRGRGLCLVLVEFTAEVRLGTNGVPEAPAAMSVLLQLPQKGGRQGSWRTCAAGLAADEEQSIVVQAVVALPLVGKRAVRRSQEDGGGVGRIAGDILKEVG